MQVGQRSLRLRMMIPFNKTMRPLLLLGSNEQGLCIACMEIRNQVHSKITLPDSFSFNQGGCL